MTAATKPEKVTVAQVLGGKGQGMGWYRVKWTDAKTGETMYGIVDPHETEAGGYDKRGLIVVEDAILPKSYAVPVEKLEQLPCGYGPDDEYDAHVDAAQKEAERVKVGKLFRLGVADGFASYVVVKVNRKTCVVEWRGFRLDRYVDRWLGYGRKMDIADIEPYCGDRLFG